MQVCYQQQQKGVMADPKKATVCTTESKMKPLLPYTDSYLVPIKLPLSPSLFLPSSAAALSLSTPQQTSTASNPVSRSGCKRLCIAPKVPKSESSVVVMSAPVAEVKEERVCVPVSEPCSSKQKEMSRSRRKQRLVPLSTEEPVLIFSGSTFFDSSLVSDVSPFQEMDCDLEPGHDLELQSETFKTPDKGSHLTSSTPSKSLEPWKITPLDKRNHSVLDCSPIGACFRKEPQHTEEEPSAVKGPLSERPPYSYMAMIQFAINSKKNKMMTVKEIYNWIEDHFLYFKNVAKPGWKNSIRHNLSLHDVFIRESAPDGKISHWTIKHEANRCLTLDQVYKPAVDPAASSFPQAMHPRVILCK
ncbi:forkhead box protein M1-like isoform X1 [Tachysurus ichikawai]